jgi:hypothetical protein
MKVELNSTSMSKMMTSLKYDYHFFNIIQAIAVISMSVITIGNTSFKFYNGLEMKTELSIVSVISILVCLLAWVYSGYEKTISMMTGKSLLKSYLESGFIDLEEKNGN